MHSPGSLWGLTGHTLEQASSECSNASLRWMGLDVLSKQTWLWTVNWTLDKEQSFSKPPMNLDFQTGNTHPDQPTEKSLYVVCLQRHGRHESVVATQ